jgi:predicted RecB family nuclease
MSPVLQAGAMVTELSRALARAYARWVHGDNELCSTQRALVVFQRDGLTARPSDVAGETDASHGAVYQARMIAQYAPELVADAIGSLDGFDRTAKVAYQRRRDDPQRQIVAARSTLDPAGRKQRARDLHAVGLSRGAIARQLRVSTSVISGDLACRSGTSPRPLTERLGRLRSASALPHGWPHLASALRWQPTRPVRSRLLPDCLPLPSPSRTSAFRTVHRTVYSSEDKDVTYRLCAAWNVAAPAQNVPSQPRDWQEAAVRFRRLTTRQRWVTKSDIARYYRCPYAFWLLDSGQITFEETVGQFQLSLMQAGTEYQQLVELSAVPVALAPDDLYALLRTEITILGTPLFEDKKQKIRGCPDGIDAAGGALYPIEIKSHRAPTKLDGLELAFYWLLLEPHRTLTASPRGVLILRRDGVPYRVDVPITETMLSTVKQLIREVRDARRNGVAPRVCGCVVCSGTRRDDVIRSVTSVRDTSMVLGVGPVYRNALVAAGYTTWDSLIGCDPEAVAQAVTQMGAQGCGPSRVVSWQLHARSLASGHPELRPEAAWPLNGPYLALDLEYDVTPDKDLIWLVGAALVEGDCSEHFYWWAESLDDVREAIHGLGGLLARHPRLPVVTWAGLSADLPRIHAACARLGIEGVAAEVSTRHFDAYRWAVGNLRLPTFSLALKEVAEYLGFRQSSDVRDGLEALSLFYTWLRSRDEKIKTRLLEYNRDDLDALAAIVSRFDELCRP